MVAASGQANRSARLWRPALRIGEAAPALESWLAGFVHPSAGADLTIRARHERFIVARSATAVLALVLAPPYLIWRGVPSAVECLALVALVMPLAAVVLLSRTGALVCAQGIASAALALFLAALCAAFGGTASPAAFLLVAVPLEAVTAGSARAFLAALAAATAGLALGLLPPTGLLGAGGRAEAVSVALATAALLGAGHALAALAVDWRLRALVGVALKAGEARESATLQALGDLVTWHDRNGMVLRASAAATRLLGVAPADLQGRGLFTRVQVADRPSFLKAISDAAVSDEPVTVELRLATEGLSGGRSSPLFVEMCAHRLDGSGTASVVATLRDVSGRMQERATLTAACAAAEAASAGRAGLLARAGDDLRRPAEAILDFSELLLAERDRPGHPARVGDAGRDYAERIHGASRRLLGTVGTLLDLSALETGRYPVAPEPLDLAGIVRAACESLGPGAERAGVTLAPETAPGLPDISADRRACLQLLMEAIGGAIRAAPAGGLVTVRARKGAGGAVLTVSGPEARTGAAQGDDLSAALLQALVDVLGGSLSRSGVLGQASLTVTLPIGRGRPAETARLDSEPVPAPKILRRVV